MKQACRYALIKTIPVLCGYLFLGMAYGLLLQQTGFGPVWALFTSLFVYAGSMQFVMIGFLGAGANLVTVTLTTLLVNCRHAFYGLSLIEPFSHMGRARPYLIASLTDETYSLLCSETSARGNQQVFLCISVFDHFYWVAGSVLGSVAGELLSFDLTGIDFAMTALFVVIFVEQWLAAKSHLPALIGLSCGVLCLLLFGADGFLLPALVLAVAALLLLRGKLDGKEASA